MDLIETVLKNHQRSQTIDDRLALMTKHVNVSEGVINIGIGLSSITLHENGVIRFNGYSQQYQSELSITLEDLIKLIPFIVPPINDR